MKSSKIIAFLLASLPALVHSYAPTDSIQDVDPAQSGYLPNHNMDPNVITGGTFGITWKNTYNTNEAFYAKPLVYTPSGFTDELVITVSDQNIIRIVDGVNGTLIQSRTLDPPFQAVDSDCGDIPYTIGITGTPIIDPATSIMYFFSKGYKGAAVGPAGTLNGQYKFYAVQIPSLLDVAGFPIIIDGNHANNDPTRYFVGGTYLQRPSLTSVGNIVIGGFGSHCGNFNYTGMLVSVSKTSGVGVTNIYAMEASPGAPSPQPLVYTTQQGGKAGVWQSGMGFPTDGDRIFIVTGNGQGSANGAVPASGRIPISTLDETAVNFAVDPSTGVLSPTDYFEPYEYQSLDGGDRDFGSSGPCLLDPTTFSGTGVDRLIVAGGKTGKVYIMNADNLGGFAQGPGGSDNVIQTIVSPNSLFAGVGSYPLEGGYIYFNPTGVAMYAYKMGVDSTGRPLFTLAGQSASTYAGKGAPTITSLNGRPGTGILWIADVNQGLVAFNAVPTSGGVLQPIALPATIGANKFQRPVFGNGRVYVTGSNVVMALGTPVTLPLSCASPINFGSVSVGQTSTVQISCTAKTAVVINGCTTSFATFQCQNSSLPLTVASGISFTFPVTWNLTQAAINQAQSNGKVPVLPGSEGASLNLYATAGASGYATDTPIQLSGTIVASQGYLAINTLLVDFGGIVLDVSASQLSSSIVLSNQGTGVLTFSGFAWQDMNVNGMPFNNVSVQPANQATIVGNSFTAMNFPTVNSQLLAGQSITIPLFFSANTVGSWASLLTFWSDGGSTDVLMTGTAANAPIASISISDGQGNWIPSPLNMAFGNVAAGVSVERQIRLCNIGASALTITLSQPPVGADLTALDPNLDLRQGTTVDVGACSYGTVIIIAPPLQPNHPSLPLSGQWLINTNGNNPDGSAFGLRTVTITATVVSRQVGPLEANGQGIYQFLGCFLDTNGRNLVFSTGIANNSIEACMTYCYGAGYSYAGTEYQVQCWCGNVVNYPSSYSPENDCNFACPGDATEVCGGNGNAAGNGYLYMYYNQKNINPATVLPSVFYSVTSSSTTSSSTTSTSSLSSSSTSSTTSSSTSTSSSSSTTTSSSSSSLTTLTTSLSTMSTSSSSSTASLSPTTSSSSSSSTSSNPGSAPSSSTSSSSSSTSSNPSSAPSSSTSSSSSSSSSNPGSAPSSSTSSSSSSTSSNPGSESSSSTSSSSSSTSSNPGSAPSSSTSSSSSSTSSNPGSAPSSSTSSSSSSSSSNPGSESSSLTSSSSSSSSASSTSSSTSSSVSSTSSSSSASSSSSSASSTSSSASSTSSSSSSVSSSTTSSISSSTSSSSSRSTSSSSSISTTSSVSSTTSSSATAYGTLNPNEPATISTFHYIGCYKDLVNNVRTLSSATFIYDPMTLESCAQDCTAYDYFGTEYGRECYCGYTLDLTLRATESDCNAPCSGNLAEICGSGARLSIYLNSIYRPPPPPPSHVASAGGFQWVSCYTEATNGRALTGPSFASSTMTVEACTTFCAGYTYAGVEWSQQCYCGNTLSAGAVPAPITQCNMLCSGNSLEYCGGSVRIDMYYYNPSLTTVSSSTTLTTSTTSTTLTTSTTPKTLSTTSTIPTTFTTPTTLSTTSTTSTTLTTSTTPTTLSSTSTIPTTSTTPTTLSTTSTIPTTSTTPTTLSTTSTTSTMLTTSTTLTTLSSTSTIPTTSTTPTTLSTTSTIPTTSTTPTTLSTTSTTSTMLTTSTTPTTLSITSTTSSPTLTTLSTSSALSTATTGPLSNSATTTTSSSTSSPTFATTYTASATPTPGYQYIGCFQDVSSGHALPLLFANSSVTPELCLAYVLSLAKQPTPTVLPYVFLEYHDECYGGSSFSFGASGVTSLTGIHACTDVCSGSMGAAVTGTAFCGGPKQFNLYATNGVVNWPSQPTTVSV